MRRRAWWRDGVWIPGTGSALTMEPTTDTLVQTDEWTAQGSLDTVRSRLLAVAEDRGAKVLVADDAQLELRFGSRLAARLGGVVMKASRERLPVRVRLDLTSANGDGVRVHATVAEDAGWNLFSLPFRTDPYRSAMSDAVDHLRAATGPASVSVR